VVSSFLSDDDTDPYYGKMLGPKFDASEEPEPPVMEPGLSPPALLRRPTSAKEGDIFPSAPTSSKQAGINSSLLHQPAPTPNFTGAENVSKRGIDGLPENSYDQQVNFDNLNHQINQIQRDIQLAIQQPALPIPQLDDLRDRLEALAGGLHGADLQGLHMKLDQLKDKPPDHTLRNVTPSSSEDVVSRLDVLTKTLNKLRSKMEEDTSYLPLIKEKLAAIQEHMEHEEAPPVPDKKELSDHLHPMQERLVDIQTKIDNLEGILVDLRKQNEGQRKVAAAVPTVEPPRSLSVFGNRDAPNDSIEPNPVPSEVNATFLIRESD
jgi:hypothetical protein